MDKETTAEDFVHSDVEVDEDIIYMSNVAETEKVNEEEIEMCLMGVNYPKSRREIVAYAINNHCDAKVISSLKHTMKNQYNDLIEVEKEILR